MEIRPGEGWLKPWPPHFKTNKAKWWPNPQVSPLFAFLSLSGKGTGSSLGMLKGMIMMNHPSRGRTLSIPNNYLKSKKLKKIIIKLWNLPHTRNKNDFISLFLSPQPSSILLFTRLSLPLPPRREAPEADLVKVGNDFLVPRVHG